MISLENSRKWKELNSRLRLANTRYDSEAADRPLIIRKSKVDGKFYAYPPGSPHLAEPWPHAATLRSAKYGDERAARRAVGQCMYCSNPAEVKDGKVKVCCSRCKERRKIAAALRKIYPKK